MEFQFCNVFYPMFFFSVAPYLVIFLQVWPLVRNNGKLIKVYDIAKVFNSFMGVGGKIGKHVLLH